MKCVVVVVAVVVVVIVVVVVVVVVLTHAPEVKRELSELQLVHSPEASHALQLALNSDPQHRSPRQAPELQ